MKISTINASFSPALRSLAENSGTLAAVAVDGPVAGPQVHIGAQDFALLAHLPTLPSSTPMPVKPVAPASSQQFEELKTLVRDLVLPAIKTVWPDASTVVTGVQIVWAGKEFWDQARDESSDATQKAIAGVRLASSVAGLYLNVQAAPTLAVNTNLIAGLVIASADKVYTARIKAADKT